MRDIKHTTGSGNVFADIGVPDSDEYLAKADLARSVISRIRERKLTQSEAAKELGIAQPKVSLLMRGLLTGFSMEKLMIFLTKLGSRVSVVVDNVPRGEASRLIVLDRSRNDRPNPRPAAVAN